MSVDDDRKILNLKFNQNQGCFVCCMESGLRIYNVEPLVEKSHYDVEQIGSIGICEMLYRSNLLAVVSGGVNPKYSNNVLHIYDDGKKEPILEITFATSIRAVRFRRDKIVVALLNKIYVFSFPAPTKILNYFETRDNPLGLCEITPSVTAEKQLLVFPGRKIGSVQQVELTNIENYSSGKHICIPAHQSNLRCLSMNQQGTRIATASNKGTLIRVWDTINRSLLVELRRGSDPAVIYSINFNKDSEYLCCSSDKGTVHIFALKNTNLNKRMLLPNVGILPKYMDSQWASTNFTVPPESACVCAFGADGNSVIAICLDGTFHKYTFSSISCSRDAFDVFLDIYDNEDNIF